MSETVRRFDYNGPSLGNQSCESSGHVIYDVTWLQKVFQIYEA